MNLRSSIFWSCLGRITMTNTHMYCGHWTNMNNSDYRMSQTCCLCEHVQITVIGSEMLWIVSHASRASSLSLENRQMTCFLPFEGQLVFFFQALYYQSTHCYHHWPFCFCWCATMTGDRRTWLGLDVRGRQLLLSLQIHDNISKTVIRSWTTSHLTHNATVQSIVLNSCYEEVKGQGSTETCWNNNMISY